MKPTDKIHFSWLPLLTGLLNQEEMLRLNQEVLPTSIYYPEKQNIFRVFQKPVSEIKVVILGQDPYPTKGNANGLAFAVNSDVKLPVSLRNIYKEIEQEDLVNKKLSHTLNEYNPEWRTLEHWEQQGVFLLNTALTVESGKAGSHLKYWENFTKKVIWYIASTNPCIWLLWGKKAQMFISNMPKNTLFDVKGYSKETIKDVPNSPYMNYILRAAHPAAEAYSSNAGFFGCNHFSYVNTILEKKSLNKINW
ncbi:uracil-DNA glycosylase [Flavobacterium phage FpV4]|uniref:Uracil-DNA glycosylase n=2 Tax=Fipvunavirus Fpv4 TaxID=2560476 RepID=A0A1B0WM66_9CAUD|nr:uracil-DNA glycosylase [Flavobacterium phage Fpv3]YP_009594110.1 uracil-DNA glycosylase [Flavobacterium phage FpV4]ALN97167.1 uracil-DNA glycosylase [Flavobacterium phage FpV4]ANB40458.1 uracil-DNA glycosylase [Flavobacterium phage Fpv3]